MTNLSILAKQSESNTLENLIADVRTAIESMPGATAAEAMTELQDALAGPSWLMIAGNEIEQGEGFRLYWVTLADFLENYDLWFSCLRAAPLKC